MSCACGGYRPRPTRTRQAHADLKSINLYPHPRPRSGGLPAILDTCFAMIGVGQGPVNEEFRSLLVKQVSSQRYPQMHGTRTAFTVPQRAAYVLSVLGIRAPDALISAVRAVPESAGS